MGCLTCRCSVTTSCPTLCNPMDCSTSGSSVLHHILEFVQILVYWVSDTNQPSHPLSPHLLLLPSIFPSIRVFSNESALCIRWPKYWNFSMSPSNENSGLIFFKIDWLDLLAVKRLPRGFSSTTDWKHQIFSTQPSLWSSSHIHMYSESTWMCILPLLGGMFYKCWSVG